MAEVETLTPATAVVSASATDIPLTTVDNESGAAAEFGTSPTQERSSNSHPHDSEYDTASDLEGGEDYDDDDDESLSDDESGSDDDDEGGSETGDEEGGSEVAGGTGVASDKLADAEAQKKVDEDRSNPQYIPKRGTFYEHDDRTAEGEVGDDKATPSSPGVVESVGDSSSIVGISETSGNSKTTISQASKTMKKWQPASGGDRWSHDRFDASEQAPKSRSELLTSYGYDIRNEDAPPRARRRRRYGRGPSKYQRNWEDEQAYLKASNKERKPPRPSDFPALNERGTKVRRSRGSLSREEKENRGERRTANAALSNEKLHNNSGGGGGGGNVPEKNYDNRERKNRRYGRTNGVTDNGRQPPREFKQKPNRVESHRGDPRERVREREQNSRIERTPQKTNTPRSVVPNTLPAKQIPSQSDHHQQQLQSEPPMQKQPNYQQSSQPVQTQQQPALSHTNLSQRLQQVQQRNDPSHVGSVQMHALATQNQQQQVHINPQPQQQQLPPQMNNQQPQQILEQRTSNAPKRYSSMRRTQHEAVQAQHIVEQQQQQQHQLQQQLQLQQQQQQQQSQIMLQDPHMLMQIYEQQQLQAQLQTLQLGQPAPATVQQPPKSHPPPPNAYPQAQAAPAAYYVTGAEQVPPTAPYANPSAAGYLPPAPPAVVYAQPQAAAPPTQPPPVQSTTPAAQAPPPSINYHQNYNTVGGTTYFVPPAQTSTRPAVLPQRRPTNAIPILPPSEKHKPRAGSVATDAKTANAPKSEESACADNIDHIIDNMFVQRPVFQPTATSSTDAKSNAEESGSVAAIAPVSADQANTGNPVAPVAE